MQLQVKICGLRDRSHIAAAVAAGADALGFVFASSPREVPLDQAADLLAAVPESVARVAVFRTPDPDVLQQVLQLPIDAVQADATWDGAADLPPAVHYLPVVADGPGLMDRLGAAMQRLPAGRGTVLVDGPGGAGLGVLGDHGRITEAARSYPITLAGGLDPDNVAEAVRQVRPVAVDVSSGVESQRGVKDPRRIRAFVAAARAAAGPLAPRGAVRASGILQ